MSINIKIVEIDQAIQTVVVKYASENSKKNIDEYPGVAFQLTNYNVKNLEELEYEMEAPTLFGSEG